MKEFIEFLNETVKRKVIYRDRKRQVVKRTDKEGYKTVDGKQERMSSVEKRNRSIAQRKAAKKRRAKKVSSNRKRKMTMKKRGNQ